MPRARHDLAPTVAVQQSIDRGRSHRLAQLFPVGLLDLGHREHAAGLGAFDERRQELLLLLGAEVLVVSAATPAHVKDGVALLRVYEATGAAANKVLLTCAAPITFANETNLLDDGGKPLQPVGNTVHFDLGPNQIKTLRLQLAKSTIAPPKNE